jgi:hypothetical protein
MMTNRQRLLAIMDGKSPDRIPWIPRLLLWWLYHRNRGTLPQKYEGWRLRDIERDLGVGTPARDGRIFTKYTKNVEAVTRHDGMDTVVDYVTPVGTVSSRMRRTPELDLAGIEAMEVEKPIRRAEDYDVMTYVIENTRYLPRYEEYLAYEEDIGEDGYPMVAAEDCPYHTFLEKFAGYENGYYQLFDHPQEVERLLDVMTQKHREELWPVIAQSPARLILQGQHFDSQLTPPGLFEKYITPYYKDLSELLHKHGKVLAMHADNDSRRILRQLKDAGYDMVECFATAPLVNCTLEEARREWGTDMIIWGGIPSVVLEESFSDEEFETYMQELFRIIAPGDAFIMGVSDNVTGPSSFSRIVRIGEMIEEFGHYPVGA